jgi:hypothetical protein
MTNITDRDKELAEQARYLFLAGEEIDSVALLFALAHHEGAKRAIEEMQVALQTAVNCGTTLTMPFARDGLKQ